MLKKLLSVLVITNIVNTASAETNNSSLCVDRQKNYTSISDFHLHSQPFGGKAIEYTNLINHLKKYNIKIVNLFGIGQVVPQTSKCTYYLDCLGTPVLPSTKNDILNAHNYNTHPSKDMFINVSYSFLDLANPKGGAHTLNALDKRFPNTFKLAGEVNLVKQALLGNQHEISTLSDIDNWKEFMDILRKKDMPILIHSDLGNDTVPTLLLNLVVKALSTYPDNKIVWAHLGLSKELSNINPKQHIAILEHTLQTYPNLYLGLSWTVLHKEYFSKPHIRKQYVKLINKYPSRFLAGTDFVASNKKAMSEYLAELQITSQINKYISDEAFRNIALGQNHADILNIKYTAPEICQ